VACAIAVATAVASATQEARSTVARRVSERRRPGARRERARSTSILPRCDMTLRPYVDVNDSLPTHPNAREPDRPSNLFRHAESSWNVSGLANGVTRS
jgi:hypothetical protein